ncbi:hypothetical protein AK812_SmicGene13985 [Symbiodinium microadriaticum]|uniref:Uncharacterized protein n=1 Tax=Symbiodinium microadriaticum TaxID=2951 RepID=A0A1Q9E6R5_SYMMI|nr:hypothetical protein AK812_SmicGene13985 [Symbiodinium microadriaticum]CAE7551095.1 unnamed protein product [Symbiodinium microadriaticum]
MAGKSLEALRRRIAVLKSFQSRLLWPPVTGFEAFGQSFPLPFRRTAESNAVLPQPLLSYLAGFFDGDGCVWAAGGTCRLAVGQAQPRQDILVLFAKTFGGAVYAHHRGRGLRQPTLQWVIAGQAAEMAASKLAAACVVKNLQLRTVATWPVQKNLRLDAKRRLAALNRHSQYDVAHHSCSWAYIAGFFDAEGYIKCESLQNTVRLSVSQKNQSVLRWMDSYWRADIGCASSWTVQRASGVTDVVICRQSDSRLLMRRLLDNGLLLKKPQALLGLSTEDVPYMEVRERIGRLSGNQSRYQTLSPEGCQRAREISRLRKLAKHRQAHGRSDEVAALLQQLQGMQQEHARLNALHAYRSLRSDIRRLLAAGAMRQAEITS